MASTTSVCVNHPKVETRISCSTCGDPGAGLATAVLLGLVYRLLLGSVGFGRLLLAVAVGYGVGQAVRWGARGQTQQPWLAIAAGLGVMGIVVAYLPALGLLANPFALLSLAAAGYGATLGLRR